MTDRKHLEYAAQKAYAAYRKRVSFACDAASIERENHERWLDVAEALEPCTIRTRNAGDVWERLEAAKAEHRTDVQRLNSVVSEWMRKADDHRKQRDASQAELIEQQQENDRLRSLYANAVFANGDASMDRAELIRAQEALAGVAERLRLANIERDAMRAVIEGVASKVAMMRRFVADVRPEAMRSIGMPMDDYIKGQVHDATVWSDSIAKVIAPSATPAVKEVAGE